jgi:hypothetical protein
VAWRQKRGRNWKEQGSREKYEDVEERKMPGGKKKVMKEM